MMRALCFYAFLAFISFVHCAPSGDSASCGPRPATPESKEILNRCTNATTWQKLGYPSTYGLPQKIGHLPDLPSYKCYLACVFETTGMMNPDGKFNEATVVAMMSKSAEDKKDLIKKAFVECGVQSTGADKCEIAAKFSDCMDKKEAHGKWE